ncbi:zf-TFIIB domain-containing protein [Rhizobium sullae]|uniref:TFIIB-type zinc ribbon-containing protein n=1 Tax=Rhizobium sullae TaxID=50338 RepID=UPI000B354D93|nr:zf-TFIIB domain-containing protein [Rhizobium sullae]
MKCPIDQSDLVMSDRQGIEIDYCPKCRGVWLDRGELDKIIERSSGEPAPYREPQREQERYGTHGGTHASQPYKKKKGGFLGEIFDF